MFVGIGGSVEDMRPEREEMVEDKVETNNDIESKEAESSKRSSGENDYIVLIMSVNFPLLKTMDLSCYFVFYI